MYEFGRILRDTRKEKGYTLKELAEHIGVKEATVQRYESGEISNVPYEKVVLIANFLKVSPSYLMGWEDIDESYSSALNAAAILVKNDDPVLSEIVDIYMNIDSEARSHLFEYARFISSQRK